MVQNNNTPEQNAAQILVDHREAMYKKQLGLKKENETLTDGIKNNTRLIDEYAEKMVRIDQALKHIAPDQV